MSLKEDYLQLESNLMLRLRKAWAPVAADIYAQMTEAVAAGRFDEARGLVAEIDLEPIAKANREYFKYTMWAYAILGASQASLKPKITGMTFENTMNNVADLLTQSLALNSTAQVQEKALQLIATAETEFDKVQKADQPRFLKDFVSFTGEGDTSLRMVTALHSTRLAAWGFLAEADLLNLHQYRLTAVIDGRTSEFCRLINGKTFYVEDAVGPINQILSAQEPEDLRTLQPWPKQDEESMKRYRDMTAQELTAEKLHIPPFHPYCRTMLTKLGTTTKPKPVVAVPEETVVPSLTPLEPVAVDPGMPTPAPKQVSTVETFEEIGIKLTEPEVEAWNTSVGVNPVVVLAEVSGVTPKEILDGHLKGVKPISFTKDGDAKIIGRKMWDADTISQQKVIFDPFTSDFFLDVAEMKAADPAKAQRFFTDLHKQMAKAAIVAGAKSLTLKAGGALGVYTYSRMGFQPAAADWIKLSEDLQLGVAESGKFAKSFAKLPADRQQLVLDLISSNDPQALMALMYLPWRMGNSAVGKYLLRNYQMRMSIDPEVLYA